MTLDEKARNLRSSAYTLIIVGSAGLLFMILVLSGVIPINMPGIIGILSKVIMTALFIMFLAFGIGSYLRSRKVAEDAGRESEKKEEIERWFLDSYDGAGIDGNVNDGDDDNDLYFDRTDFIREKISERFLDVDESLMSVMVEELYAQLFD